MPELVLRLEGVCQSYRRGRECWEVLSGVSLTVAAGEFVGVLGGCNDGKTTLLEIAAGLRVPDAGSVLFEGRDLVRCSDDERTELLGDRIVWMPLKDFAGFEVLEYVALPLGMDRGGMRPADDRAREALRRVGAESCEGRGWDDLSDWDRLLVTFARGYAARPALMVVDDLLDALGAGGRREAGELLRTLAGELQCGVLVTASDMSALLAAHRVLRFDGDGGITQTPDHNLHRLLPRRAAS
jgi:predicted ABC-type transport system involved in lysophospholipase L1 biosynthesis ATPase subunit